VTAAYRGTGLGIWLDIRRNFLYQPLRVIDMPYDTTNSRLKETPLSRSSESRESDFEITDNKGSPQSLHIDTASVDDLSSLLASATRISQVSSSSEDRETQCSDIDPSRDCLSKGSSGSKCKDAEIPRRSTTLQRFRTFITRGSEKVPEASNWVTALQTKASPSTPKGTQQACNRKPRGSDVSLNVHIPLAPFGALESLSSSVSRIGSDECRDAALNRDLFEQIGPDSQGLLCRIAGTQPATKQSKFHIGYLAKSTIAVRDQADCDVVMFQRSTSCLVDLLELGSIPVIPFDVIQNDQLSSDLFPPLCLHAEDGEASNMVLRASPQHLSSKAPTASLYHRDSCKMDRMSPREIILFEEFVNESESPIKDSTEDELCQLRGNMSHDSIGLDF
jgi:hypothetical protein